MLPVIQYLVAVTVQKDMLEAIVIMSVQQDGLENHAKSVVIV